MIALLLLVTLQKQEVQNFDVNGVKREAIVCAPTAKTAAPLVFVFHGHGGNMRQSQRSFGIDKLWPEAVVVYPQGLPSKGKTDPEGIRNGWQQKKGDAGDRDLAFFDLMLSTLKKEHKIDGKRVYVTGHSNGGRFTYLLWSERHDTFAAVAPSASPGMFGLKPLPAFIVAGEQDTLVPFRVQQLSINTVRRVLGTDESKAKVDGYTHIELGPHGMDLGTYIFPGPHTFPREAATKIVEFFKSHHK
jgi:polyhydroxybutyrate depolymerase